MCGYGRTRSDCKCECAYTKVFVKPLLTSNWDMGCQQRRRTKARQISPRQLRRILGISWPHRISNKRLYELTGEKPVSLFVTQQRWRLFGHVLRSHPDTPANKAMQYFFEPVTMIESDGLGSYDEAGRRVPRISLVGTIDRDLRRAAEQCPTLVFRKLKTASDLQLLARHATNRKEWQELATTILNYAQDNLSL